jgi:hypothetical protein
MIGKRNPRNENQPAIGQSSLIGMVLFLVSGCATTVGPELIVNSHVDYNKAVTQVINEELLLNIVRRRYYEAPQFVTVESISTQITNSRDVAAGASFDDGVDFDRGSIDGTIGFADKPTITLTPRAGNEIAGPLTSRMSYGSVGKLANSGYRFDMILALMVENMTNIRGPQTGVGDGFRPGSKEYVEVIERVGTLIDQNQLVAGTFRWEDPYSDISYTRDQITLENQIAAIALGDGRGRYRTFDGGDSYYLTDKGMYAGMWIPDDARQTDDGKRIIELLNLNPDPLKKIWRLDTSKVIYGSDLNWKEDEPRSVIKLQVRSFYSVMNFLAYGVQVPPNDEQEGRAFSKQYYDQAVADGRSLDLANYFAVRWSEDAPEDAFVAVRHRGIWFYIDDRDHISKRFFNAVYDLFNLEIAPSGGSGGPVLTLPVN